MPVSKKIILVVIGGLLATVTAAQALLITRVWDPLWSPFRPSPEQVLAQMVQKSKDLDTFHLVQNLGIQGNVSQEPIATNFRIDANVRLVSDIDHSTIEKLQERSDLVLNLNVRGGGESMQLTLEGKSVTLGNTAYFQITSLSLPEEIQTMLLLLGGIDTSQFLNRWIRVDQQALLAFSGLDEELVAQELQKQTELQKELQELALSPEFYAVRQELPDEELAGSAVYHYVLEVKFAEMLEAIFNKVFEQEGLTGDDAFAAELTKGAIKGAVDAALQKIGPITADMWIDKQTLYLHKAAVAKIIDFKQLDPRLEGTLSLSYEAVYSDLNKPIQITAPEQSIPLQELLAPLLESLMQQPASSSLPLQTLQMRDAQRRTDIKDV